MQYQSVRRNDLADARPNRFQCSASVAFPSLQHATCGPHNRLSNHLACQKSGNRRERIYRHQMNDISPSDLGNEKPQECRRNRYFFHPMTVTHKHAWGHLNVLTSVHIQYGIWPVCVGRQHADPASLSNKTLTQAVDRINRSAINYSRIERWSDVEDLQWLI